MALRGVSHPLSCTSHQENRTIQRTAKNYTENTGGGNFKHWDIYLAKATWLVNTRECTNRAGPAQSKLARTVEGDKVPIVHMKNTLGKTIWVSPASGKGKPTNRIAFVRTYGRI